MLTQEEIKKVRKSIRIISIDNVNKMIKNGGIKPTFLSNGYAVSLSLDVIRENLRLIHLSVSNTKGNTNIEMAKSITSDIIGEGYQMIGPMNVKNVIHFMKTEEANTMIELMNMI
jgi:hypothetical protein